MESIYHFV